ncbi:AraC family transcriptional regulator [Amycolatopsis sp. DSM 110486]|uniref:AraC family transcriptional regulator n=1 Tax=Amycolatopsis sp. DSM 110486 TaxID=2865832 RepID=UPI001C6A2C50|nr:AraC family transcriptional regulator [Amycolatopsis sp. DSM 110486]QYN22042.1 AraC family transcriptional regulator [Amycolatopsis sp. DSM 110486]
MGSYEVRVTDAAAGAPEDPTGFWVEHVRDNHGALHVRFAEPAGFRGGTVVQRAGEQQLVEFWSDAVEYSRTRADIRADDDSGLVLVLAGAGELVVDQDGADVRLRPGQGVVAGKSRPLVLRHAGRARGWVLNLGAGRAAGVVDCSQGLGAVVRTMVRTLSAQRSTLDRVEFVRAAESIAGLVPLCVRPDGRTGSLAAVEGAVRVYVAEHATDPDLTPAGVAHALGWSLRQVQLALERAGTSPGRLIREARLGRAMEVLRRAPGATVGSVAFACGFRSATSFGVAFKQRYGMTPGEARESG